MLRGILDVHLESAEGFVSAASGNVSRMRMPTRVRRNDPAVQVADQTSRRATDDPADITHVDDIAQQPGDARDGVAEGVAAHGSPATPRQGESTDTPDEPPPAGASPDTVPVKVETTPVLRIPSFSVTAPIGGWLAAWGAAAVAIAALGEAGVALGFGLGIADGSIDTNSGFWAGLWTLVVQAGAFLVGGYVAGRMARTRAVGHAVLAWSFAMAATAADAIIVQIADDRSSVLAPLGLPRWAGLDYDRTVVVPLIIFAVGALLAAVVGGTLAAGANRLETTFVETGGRRKKRPLRRRVPG